MAPQFICKYCERTFATADGRSKHLARFRECRAKDDAALRRRCTWDGSVDDAHIQDNHWTSDYGLDAFEGPETVSAIDDHALGPGQDAVVQPVEVSECDVVEVECFPGNAGAALGEGKPKFETMKRKLLARPSAALKRLQDIKAWEKARWLLTSNISGGARDRYFKVHKVNE